MCSNWSTHQLKLLHNEASLFIQHQRFLIIDGECLIMSIIVIVNKHQLEFIVYDGIVQN